MYFFYQYLTFHYHISGICKSTHFHLRSIEIIRNLLTIDATAQLLIHALITSRLDFCNSILYNLPNKQIERLQRIQNQAARMLKRIPRRNHITPILRELHWLKIHDRIIFKILILTLKAVNNTAPEYLCDLIRLVTCVMFVFKQLSMIRRGILSCYNTIYKPLGGGVTIKLIV